ncbi:MAG: hypothetical protein HW391_797 [Chloroflexi bacterium]|nr:hypothetical protein [Chloroflexota bacterium]
MTDPDRLLGSESLGDAADRLNRVVAPASIVRGWATVDLDRAMAESAAAHPAPGGLRVAPASDDLILGGRCRLLRYAAGRDVLLLEPSTEGRLAAALARYGEGTVVLYLIGDAGAAERARRAGFRLTTTGSGPFGAERLVLIGPRYGPFLVLVEAG